MINEIGESAVLRRYLLGILDDAEMRERFETALVTDESFGDLVSVAGNDLIEDFLDGNLTQSESVSFMRLFLASPDRRRQFGLTKNLRMIAKRPSVSIPAYAKESGTRPMRYLQFAALVVVLVVAGIVLWRLVIPSSDTEQGIALLQALYPSQRRVQARITVLPEYAPFSQTRGESSETSSSNLRERAQRYLLDASSDPNDAAAHHGMGLYYLIERDLEKAQRELEIAISLAPGNANFQSDVGVVYLERARSSLSRAGEATKLELLNESVKHFDRAIAFNAHLAEAYFGRALALAELASFEAAKASWKKYLEIDSASKWADEARRNLQKLEEIPAHDQSSVDLKSEFIEAFLNRDEEKAGRILAANRELIRDRYIPVRLAMEITVTPPESRGLSLQALKFSGAIEMKLAGDPFANEIARFYMALTESEIGRLRDAHQKLRYGYNLCLDQNFGAAGPVFASARDQFTSVGDIWESKIAEYFVGYALINAGQNEEGERRLMQVVRFADERDFPWLEATAQYWVGGGYVKSKQHTKALRAYERALNLAEKINDGYAVQRNLLELANRHSYAGQHRESLRYLHRALEESATPGSSSRQRYRTLVDAFTILSSAGLFEVARPMTLEATIIADRLNDPVWKSQARGFAASASAQLKDFVDARERLIESKTLAESIGNTGAKQRLIAFSELRLADVERNQGDFSAAEGHYREAVRYYDTADMPLNREDAHNGLLKTYLALGRTEELQQQIPLNIELVEAYRTRISEESHRASFLDTRVNVYDIATTFEFNRGDIVRAYEYTEMSSSRALLDWIARGKSTAAVDAAQRNVMLGSVTSTSSLARIRDAMSDNVQLIQYSVLDDRLLIWLISKKKFVVKEVGVAAPDLADKIDTFRRIILAREEFEADNLRKSGRTLYDLLIAPIRADIDPDLEVCIIPNKSLFGLPFSALHAPDGNSLLAEFRLLFSPSASVFLHASATASRKAERSDEYILAVGNPTFDRNQARELAYVPDAEAEAIDVAANYRQATVLLNAAAVKPRFLSALKKSEIIHFAGHYVSTPGLPSSSYLVMANDGRGSDEARVTNLELAHMDLPAAKLVVLSACQTAGEVVSQNGEGMIGLSRTMLAVDSPLTIGSHWAVDSESTAAVMRRFHYLRKSEKLTSTAALRQAQLDLKNETTGRFRAPFYWSAFAVFGGHANF